MFAVVFNVDGRPVDRRPLEASDLVVESPEDDSHVVFVHSKTEFPAAPAEASSIHALGGRYWIVGRIRLDAREDIRARLSDRSGALGRDGSDAELCLQAYAAWGDAFVDRLAGDFCFALWDGVQKKLVCVRDQLGIRCLFHTRVAGTWLVGDALDWIAAQPNIARDLDDTWVADFLTAGHSLEFERTVYRDIRRLAPAHVLTFSKAGSAMRRYWRLDIGDPLYFPDRRRYAEVFVDLLSKSVAARLPSGRVGIAMSGGLDSTTLAACAVGATADASRVVAECIHFEQVPSDREKYFSSLTARHLGIELRHRPGDGLQFDPRWWERGIATPEPSALVATAHFTREIARERAQRAAVWFHGEGPDNALAFERDDYLAWLIGRRDWRRLAEAGLFYLKIKGLAGWWETLRRYVGRRPSIEDPIDVPPWIEPSFARRLDLEERLGGGTGRGSCGAEPVPRHAWRPEAMASFNDPIWPAVFADYEFEESLGPMVLRHPFLDLRVLEFMLTVPTVPWAREKLLLRDAMRGRLPGEVLARKKEPLLNPTQQSVIPARGGLPPLSRNGSLDRYVDTGAVSAEHLSRRRRRNALAVHALDQWLSTRPP